MKKEEILQKAQSKKAGTPDEMELQMIQKGNSIALGCIFVISFILMIAKIIADEPWYDVYSIFFGSMAAQHIYKGVKCHQKHEWVLGILSSVAAILTMSAYLYEILG